MGNNYCKEIEISPSRQITTSDLENIWQRYDHDKGALSYKYAIRFLKDFAEVYGTPYDSDLANLLIIKCATGEGSLDVSESTKENKQHAKKRAKGLHINYDQFQSLFFSATSLNQKQMMSHSLQQLQVQQQQQQHLRKKLNDSTLRRTLSRKSIAPPPLMLAAEASMPGPETVEEKQEEGSENVRTHPEDRIGSIGNLGNTLWQQMEEAAQKMKEKEEEEEKLKEERKKEKRRKKRELENVEEERMEKAKRNEERQIAFLYSTDSTFIWIGLLCLHVATAPSSSFFLSPFFLIWLAELLSIMAWSVFTFFSFSTNIQSVHLIASLLSHINNAYASHIPNQVIVQALKKIERLAEPHLIHYQRVMLGVGSFILSAIIVVRVPGGFFSFFLVILPLMVMIGLLFSHNTTTLKNFELSGYEEEEKRKKEEEMSWFFWAHSFHEAGAAAGVAVANLLNSDDPHCALMIVSSAVLGLWAVHRVSSYRLFPMDKQQPQQPQLSKCTSVGRVVFYFLGASLLFSYLVSVIIPSLSFLREDGEEEESYNYNGIFRQFTVLALVAGGTCWLFEVARKPPPSETKKEKGEEEEKHKEEEKKEGEKEEEKAEEEEEEEEEDRPSSRFLWTMSIALSCIITYCIVFL